MADLHVGGLVLKNRYKSLKDAVEHARRGDIIHMHKSDSITAGNEPIINSNIGELTIDGMGNTISVSKESGGIVADNNRLTIKNLTFKLGARRNAINMRSESGALNIENIMVEFNKKDDARDWVSPISGPDSGSISINNSTIPFLNTMGNSLLISNSTIGCIYNPISVIDIKSLIQINNSEISSVLSHAEKIQINNSSTFGNLEFQDSKIEINNINVHLDETPLKKYKKLFKDQSLIKEHITFFTFLNESASINNISINGSSEYTYQFYNIINNDLTLTNSNLPDHEYTSHAKNSKIHLQSGHGPNWNLDNSEIIDMNTTGKGESNAYKELQEMIGLDSVKEQLNNLLNNAKMKAQRQARGIDSDNDFNINMVFGGNPGTGKAEWVENHIFTPNGERRFGDLKPGDYVFDENGKPTKIKNIYPRGLMDAYELTTNQNRSGIYSKDHIFSTRYKSTQAFKNTTIEEMIQSGLRYPRSKNGRTGNHKFKILTNKAVHFEANHSLPIDPYTMGAFIANGCLTNDYLTISTDDEWIVNKIAINNNFSQYTKSSNRNYDWRFQDGDALIKTEDLPNPNNRLKSHQKFIPDEYIFTSIQNRLELIQGLMDNDGSIVYAEGRYRCTYSTTSKKLANGIQLLIASLGWSSSLRPDTRPNRNTCYTITMSLSNYDKYKLFSLPRKKEIAQKAYDMEKNRKNHKSYETTEIINIKPLNKQLEMMCIEVDNPTGLYLSNDFIVTHNTSVAKLFGQILHEEHILPKDTFVVATRKDLVGKHVGETAIKTHDLIMSAVGGVLLIDEAYSLMPQGGVDFAQEAVDQLVMDATELKGQILIILAGYTEPITNFLNNANVGLNRRFPTRIDFPDYTLDDLLDMIILNVSTRPIDMSQENFDYLEDLFTKLWRQEVYNKGRTGIDGNGGYVENLIRDLVAARDDRLAQLGNIDQLSDQELIEITKPDIDTVFNQRLH